MKAFLSVLVIGGGVVWTVIAQDIGIIMFVWAVWLCITSAIGMLTEGDTGETGHYRASNCRVIFLASLGYYLSYMCLIGMDKFFQAVGYEKPLNNPVILVIDIGLFVLGISCFFAALIMGINYLFFARESREWDRRREQLEMERALRTGPALYHKHQSYIKKDVLWEDGNRYDLPYEKTWDEDENGNKIPGTEDDRVDYSNMGLGSY